MGERRRPRRLPEDGFSLVELLVAIFLFGLVMMALTGVFISSARSIGDQRLRTAATRVATDRLETLRSLPFEQLDAQAGQTPVPTPDGRTFTVATAVVGIDPATGAAAVAGGVKRVTVTVRWTSAGRSREVSSTTAIARDDQGPPVPAQSILSITIFPNPAVTDVAGRPLQDVEVTLTLKGFAASTLAYLSWTNADGTAGAKTLTSAAGVNWLGTIPKSQIRGALNTEGKGEVQFNVAVGSLVTVSTLSLEKAVLTPPVITVATIDRNPILVARPTSARASCTDRNQCQNTTDVTFSVSVSGLSPAQDSVIVQYQLADGTFEELPLAPNGGQWSATVRQRTTKFRSGTGRTFRFNALRSADGATAATTVTRDVVSI